MAAIFEFSSLAVLKLWHHPSVHILYEKSTQMHIQWTIEDEKYDTAAHMEPIILPCAHATQQWWKLISVTSVPTNIAEPLTWPWPQQRKLTIFGWFRKDKTSPFACLNHPNIVKSLYCSCFSFPKIILDLVFPHWHRSFQWTPQFAPTPTWLTSLP